MPAPEIIPDDDELETATPPPASSTPANEKNEKNENDPPGTDGNSFNSSNSFSNARPTLDPLALHGTLGEIVRRHDGCTEADPAAILGQLLVGVGNAIGKSPYFLADGTAHYANLFTVVVGRTSKARKGTSWIRARYVLESIDELWAENRIKSGLVSGEGVVQAFNEADERLLVYEGEFSQVLQAARREGNTLSPMLRQFWDGGRVAVLRRKDAVEVDKAHLSIVGHITLAELHRLLAGVEISNGLANRVLWVHAERTTKLPFGGQVPHLDEQIERLGTAIHAATSKGLMQRTDGADALWARLYNEMDEELPGRLGEVTDRAAPQTMRLAMIYALVDGADHIDAEHLEAGYAFWRYCQDSAAFIFGDHLMSEKAAKILKAVKRRPLSMTEVHGLFNNNASKSEIEAALQELGARVKIEAVDGGGKRLKAA